jgi:hypothetical protein
MKLLNCQCYVATQQHGALVAEQLADNIIASPPDLLQSHADLTGLLELASSLEPYKQTGAAVRMRIKGHFTANPTTNDQATAYRTTLVQ